MTNDDLFHAGWGDHQWVQAHARLIKIESGEAIFQHRCTRCGRDFITLLSSGRRYAVGVSMFSFHQLDDEVSQRWLGQQCPARDYQTMTRTEKDGSPNWRSSASRGR
jgi:hypothetical protein